jgi:transcriptional antiterminator RfaH
MPWYTVNTRSQHERVADLSLQQLGVETFFPQLMQRKVIRRKAETRIGPLFPGYLFARFRLDTHYRAVTYANGVRNVVTFGTIPATVEDEIIEGIRARLHDGYLTVAAPSFMPGQIMRIQTGPLQGLEAVFVREMSDHERVVLLLRTLTYQARVVVPVEHLANA